MSTNNIKEFKKLVADELIKKYKMNEFDANKAILNSYLTIALKVDAETAMHDSIDSWADFIYEEIHSEQLKEM